MSAPTPDLSLLSVVVAVLTLLVGPQIAPALGAYSIILLAWLGGVMVGVWRRPPGSRMGVAGFVAVSLIVTLGTTVPAADALAQHMPMLDAKGLLFPIAVLIPAIGHNWLDIAAWVWSLRPSRLKSSGEQ